MLNTTAENLSEGARKILQLDAGKRYRALVPTEPYAPAEPDLAALSANDLLVPPANQPPFAHAMLAGLWLWHDFLDTSHTISQALDFEEGSFWHAIMHRREGDFSNSKYWYRKVSGREIYPSLAAEVAAQIADMPPDKLILKLTWTGWDPFAWVDLVEAVQGDPADPRHAACIAIQQIEWRILFDHCARRAQAETAGRTQ